MPRRIYEYSRRRRLDAYNLISTIGSFILARRACCVTVVNVLVLAASSGARRATTRGRRNTLEWFTPSPPPEQQLRRDPARALVEPMKDIRARRCAGRRSRRPAADASRSPWPRAALCTRRPPLPSAGARDGLATFVLIIVGGVVRRVATPASAAGRPARASRAGRSATATSCRASTSTRSSSTPTAPWPIVVGIMIVASGRDSRGGAAHRPVHGARRGRCWCWSLAQGALGGATVEKNLEEGSSRPTWASRCCCSARARSTSGAAANGAPPASSTAGARCGSLSVAASVAVLCTIVAGGYMAGTRELRPGRLPARRRRPHGLRQGVPHLQR